ncbi:MAG: hypothetical protein AB7P03_30245 [Kofleriaceae bacterium]
MTGRLTRGWIVIAILVCGGVGHAEDRKLAERYFRAGAKAYAAQNFGAAATNFDEAFRAAPLPEIAFSAAQAYRRLYRIDPKPSHVQRAVELYRAYLDQVKTGGRVGDAADNLAEMEAELRRLKASGVAVSGIVDVTRTRLGVSVTLADQQSAEASAMREIGDATGELTRGLSASIDGTQVQPFALVDVDAKEHVISVTADGYFPVEKKAVAVEGQSSFIDVELKPRPASVKVSTEDGARIAVDGRAVATAPSAPLELGVGKHLITIVRRGREPFGRELVVARGEAVTVSAPLMKTARRRAVPWVLAGAGALAVGAVTTGILAGVHDSRAEDLLDQIDAGNAAPSVGDRYDREVDRRDQFVTGTWILGGAAVATAAVGVLLFAFDMPSAENIQIAPTTSGGGVTVSGTF